MPRAIYRDDQKTRNGHEIVLAPCDCTLARKERKAGKPVHKAFKLASEYTDPGDMSGWTCSKSLMQVSV